MGPTHFIEIKKHGEQLAQGEHSRQQDKLAGPDRNKDGTPLHNENIDKDNTHTLWLAR